MAIRAVALAWLLCACAASAPASLEGSRRRAQQLQPQTAACTPARLSERAAQVTQTCCAAAAGPAGHRRVQQGGDCVGVPSSCLSQECADVFGSFFSDCHTSLAAMADFADFERLDAECAALAGPTPVLFVVSAAATVPMTDGSSMAAGFWAGEFAEPARALLRAGFAVHVATPGGAVPVPDRSSLAGADTAATLRREFPGLLSPMVLEDLGLADLDAARYAAIIIPGGYSPMADLAASAPLGVLLRGAVERRLVIAAICHGPAALLSARGGGGQDDGDDWPFRGMRMTGFTDEEEEARTANPTDSDPTQKLKQGSPWWPTQFVAR